MKFRTILAVLAVAALVGGWGLAVLEPVFAAETLIWEEDVYSSGVPVVSPMLQAGHSYRIVASLTWWYDYDDNLAADAMYYTTDPSNNIFWGNHFICPGGHSFLQINGSDVNWGPFSNGNMNHTYNIMRIGEDASLSFQIVDWIDGYANNVSHIHLLIYTEITVGGHILEEAQSLLSLFGVVALILAAGVVVPLARKRFF